MRTLMMTLLLAMAPWVWAGEKLLVEFQVYLGAYEADSPAQVVVTLPTGRLTEAKGSAVIEDIQSTFKLKSMRLLGAPVIEVALPGEATVTQGTSDGGPTDTIQNYRLRVKTLSKEGNRARLKVGLGINGQPETAMDILAKLGTGVALANRLDGHMLILLATVHEEGKEIIRPQPLKKVHPEYPRELKEQKIAGTVVLRVTIDASGKVSDIQPETSDHESLTQAAVAAVKEWTWRPGTVKGQPKGFTLMITIHFRLE